MNKRQKKKIQKKMREKATESLGLKTTIEMLENTRKFLCDAMATYARRISVAESLTRQRATGKRKKRIAVSGRNR